MIWNSLYTFLYLYIFWIYLLYAHPYQSKQKIGFVFELALVNLFYFFSDTIFFLYPCTFSLFIYIKRDFLKLTFAN